MKEKRISHIAATPKLVYHKREMQSVEFDPLE